MSKIRWALRFTVVATLIAFIVILLGAYTRLKDAGLGCPDWPGCYGQLTVPNAYTSLKDTPFSKKTLDRSKAWPEMIHRYAAVILILLSFSAAILILRQFKLSKQPVIIALILLGLLFLQGLLGKWTVTLHLNPLVVMSHLLGGLTLLSLLWLLILRLTPSFYRMHPTNQEKKLRPWTALGLFILILQISLGAWTSANYAAFVCPDFPLCQGQWWPKMNFSEGFQVWLSTDKNFEGGILSSTARTAIQITHRIGALLTTLYLGFLSWKILKRRPQKLLNLMTIALLGLLITQISLGILNILWVLPLGIAIAHNGIAAFLLLDLISLNVYLNAVQPLHPFQINTKT